jgi:ABC-type sugar transport system ATPase subunit
VTSQGSILRTEQLSKQFGNIHAVENVDFSVQEGEVMALVGDNGAGKSTLIKIICGVYKPTSGRMFVRGESVAFEDFNDARKHGIETVYQELALAENQTVAANVFLGQEPTRNSFFGRVLNLVDEERMFVEAAANLDRVKIPVDPHAKVKNTSGGQQQASAIARALQSEPDILIMDEPTSALSIEGARNVLRVIDDLRKQGLTIILISHNIRHVLGIADRISVLAQGRIMGVREASEATRNEIIALMMGAEDESEFEDFDLSRTAEPEERTA